MTTIGNSIADNESIFSKNGFVKENNEDSATIFSGSINTNDSTFSITCASLADGVGGRPAGEVASRISIQTFSEFIMRWFFSHESQEPSPPIVLAMQSANEKILQEAVYTERGMATTFVSCIKIGMKLYYGAAGDSSIFLVRNEKPMKLLNEIHRESGTGRLTSCLGFRTDFRIDSGVIDLLKGDRIALTSDGITDMIKNKLIEKIIREGYSASQAAENLVNRALENGGRDNATTVILFI